MTGLGVLGLKQLFFGRSILARHPIPFYIAAALSVGTGYSFIKKRLKNLSKKNQRLHIDWLLTASALTLALIQRESSCTGKFEFAAVFKLENCEIS